MRNIKKEEVFVGACVRIFDAEKASLSVPMFVHGITGEVVAVKTFDGLTDNDYMLSKVVAITIDETILKGFGFKRAKGDNVWLKQIADMRITVALRWRGGVQECRRCAISGKITCWNEEIRYLHELQRWWNDRVYFPYNIPLIMKWRGVTEETEELY